MAGVTLTFERVVSCSPFCDVEGVEGADGDSNGGSVKLLNESGFSW